MLSLQYQFQKGGFLGVEYEGRQVMLQVCTFGISPTKLQKRLDTQVQFEAAGGPAGGASSVCATGMERSARGDGGMTAMPECDELTARM